MFDNAQLEVRIAAHFTEDPDLLAACKSGDVHASLMETFGLSDRRLTKIAVFGTMYLGGPGAIIGQAKKFGVRMTWEEAQEIQKEVHRRMPTYFRRMKQISELRVVDGLFGRRHVIHGHPSEGYMGRQAVNFPVQGGASDVTKFQMLALDSAGFDVRGQVHDSIWVVSPPELRYEKKREGFRREVIEVMEAASPPLLVPIKVEWQKGME